MTALIPTAVTASNPIYVSLFSAGNKDKFISVKDIMGEEFQRLRNF
jgi:hypothetical protein